MNRFILLFIFIAIVVACNDPAATDKNTAVDSIAGGPPVTDSVPATVDTVPQNIQIDSVIYLSFTPGTNSVSVEGHIAKRGDPVVCILRVVQGKTLEASLEPENKNATIRFSHLYLPDGKSDGPFGQSLKYKLLQQGLYKIYIGPNKMAGDPVSTDFILHVKVE